MQQQSLKKYCFLDYKLSFIRLRWDTCTFINIYMILMTHESTVYGESNTVYTIERIGKKLTKTKLLLGGESNPGLPRDRRRYSPLYYQGEAA